MSKTPGTAAPMIKGNHSDAKTWRCQVLSAECNVTFSPDGSLLAIGLYSRRDHEGYIQLVHTADGSSYRTVQISRKWKWMPQHGLSPRSVDFSPDGKLLAVGTSRGAFVFDVTQWESEKNKDASR